MRNILIAAGAVLIAGAAFAQTAVEDPYLWLEEIQGSRPLEQVKAWNADATAQLTATPGYEAHRQRALAILESPANIVLPEAVIGDRVLNHWIDAKNPRGLWRAASLQSYVAGKPDWKVLIDVDALGKAEGKSWVWHGADCLGPTYRRCLVSLSPGGGDADVVREFDLSTGTFVPGGFEVPLSKNSVDWIDENTVLVGYAHGGDSETRSGYQRQLKEWRRGTPLASARVLAESEITDIGIYAGEIANADARYPTIFRTLGYFDQRRKVRRSDGQWVDLNLPVSADLVGLVGNRLVMKIEDRLGAFEPGTLVDYDFAALLAGCATEARLVFAPSPTQAVETAATTDNFLWVKLLDHVSGKLIALTPTTTGWSQRTMPLAANSTVSLLPTAAEQDMAFATVESMLSPTSLVSVSATGTVTEVQSLPAQFDASNMRVEQRFATSKDGTRVPYFLVRRKDVSGPVNVLVHAYGGFQAAQTPTYLTGQPYRSGPLGLFLVEEGNAYVLANIRGGGEYGPAWHRGALREKRQNSFDDLEAVSRDLIAAGIARRNGVAISGRSNGGVLVGAAMNQHPDLYAATIVGSPLFDMQRYSKLSAGASWIDEYGDPDKPADWAFMSLYSPYQNVRSGVRYPPMFLYLSTQDDRVHPGHARKMAAKLKAGGSRVYYHEYLEGGHSVGADREEDAVRAALEWAFLTKELGSASGKGERGR